MKNVNEGTYRRGCDMDIEKIRYNEISRNYEQSGVITVSKVVYNDPATIVYWSDGTKTVVKCDGEVFDKEKGLAMAFAKRGITNSTVNE